jgi:hypothetical protein
MSSAGEVRSELTYVVGSLGELPSLYGKLATTLEGMSLAGLQTTIEAAALLCAGHVSRSADVSTMFATAAHNTSQNHERVVTAGRTTDNYYLQQAEHSIGLGREEAGSGVQRTTAMSESLGRIVTHLTALVEEFEKYEADRAGAAVSCDTGQQQTNRGQHMIGRYLNISL